MLVLITRLFITRVAEMGLTKKSRDAGPDAGTVVRPSWHIRSIISVSDAGTPSRRHYVCRSLANEAAHNCKMYDAVWQILGCRVQTPTVGREGPLSATPGHFFSETGRNSQHFKP